jgi:hypothetical protein
VATNTSGEAAQIEFRGFGNFVATTNANLNNNENRGTGSAQYLRANGTGVTVLYGWREDALGSTTACRGLRRGDRRLNRSERMGRARIARLCPSSRFPGASLSACMRAEQC